MNHTDLGERGCKREESENRGGFSYKAVSSAYGQVLLTSVVKSSRRNF